jgi:hypothetical protein
MTTELDGEENFEGFLTDISSPKKKRGRPSSTPQPTLLGRRESLASVLDAGWGLVGWELRTAKTLEDIRSAFKALDQWGQDQIQLFTHAEATEATPRQLRLRAREIGQLVEQERAAAATEQRAQELLTRAAVALTQAKSSKRELEIEQVFKRRNTEHRSAKHLSRELSQKERLLSKRFRNERAFFAQTELLSFLRSGRYSFTPVNLANAMAGLPDMGWRQSAKRCSSHKSHFEEGQTWWLFRLIRRAMSAEKQSRELSLVQLVNSQLQRQKLVADYRAVEVKKNWYHLRRAIETISSSSKHHPSSLPYRIIAEYHNNLRLRSPEDLLFEEEEQLK